MILVGGWGAETYAWKSSGPMMLPMQYPIQMPAAYAPFLEYPATLEVPSEIACSQQDEKKEIR